MIYTQALLTAIFWVLVTYTLGWWALPIYILVASANLAFFVWLVK